jgi:hypothetical protein
MRLEPLCDVTWTYDLLHEVEAPDGGDGRIYGQGTGIFTGRVAGTAQWSNFPRLRDGFARPDARGVIHVDGGEILFELAGLSSLTDGSGIHVLTFETGQSAYTWLNHVIAVGEGTVDVENARLAMRYYACTAELPLPLFAGQP